MKIYKKQRKRRKNEMFKCKNYKKSDFLILRISGNLILPNNRLRLPSLNHD